MVAALGERRDRKGPGARVKGPFDARLEKAHYTTRLPLWMQGALREVARAEAVTAGSVLEDAFFAWLLEHHADLIPEDLRKAK